MQVNGRWYTGEENCSSKKEAENLAAEKACVDFQIDNEEYLYTEPTVDDNDPSKHFPLEHADIEEYLVNMLGSFGGRIRKVKPPNGRGLYRVEITGNYRYCENIKKHHKKNPVYFLVDPVKKVYYQKCHDPDCQGFQSAKQPMHLNPQAHNSTSEYLHSIITLIILLL